MGNYNFMGNDKIFFIKIKLTKRVKKILAQFCWIFIHSKIARKLYREYLIGSPRQKYLNDCNNVLTKKILDGFCIAVLPASTGDSLLFLENKHLIEKIHNIKTFPVVRKSHKIIPYLCGIDDFLIIENLNDILDIQITKALYPEAKKLLDIGQKTPHLQKQQIFLAHIDQLPTRQNNIQLPGIENEFIEYVKYLYDIPYNNQLEQKNLLNKLPNNIPKYENSIILAPQTATPIITQKIPIEFWDTIAIHYQNKGMKVYYNSIKRIKELDNHAIWLNCSLEDALIACKNTKEVFSIRSGLCDLLRELGNKLTIIYPDEEFLKKFSIKDMYKVQNINEYIYNENLLNSLLQ